MISMLLNEYVEFLRLTWFDDFTENHYIFEMTSQITTFVNYVSNVIAIWLFRSIILYYYFDDNWKFDFPRSSLTIS